jgi:hypothetical protein
MFSEKSLSIKGNIRPIAKPHGRDARHNGATTMKLQWAVRISFGKAKIYVAKTRIGDAAANAISADLNLSFILVPNV